MRRFLMIALAVAAAGFVVFALGRRRAEGRREAAFREELETLPTLSTS